MQSPDVNVLVSAFREDAVHHERCRTWLVEALSGRDRVGLFELVLSGVLRVLTHPEYFTLPRPARRPSLSSMRCLLSPRARRCVPAPVIGVFSEICLRRSNERAIGYQTLIMRPWRSNTAANG